jgi:hypothetical protein
MNNDSTNRRTATVASSGTNSERDREISKNRVVGTQIWILTNCNNSYIE